MTSRVVEEDPRRDDAPEGAEDGLQLGLGQRLGEAAHVQVGALHLVTGGAGNGDLKNRAYIFEYNLKYNPNIKKFYHTKNALRKKGTNETCENK